MKIHTTDHAPAALGPYSQAVETASGLVFVSGQIGLRPDGSLAGEDITAQTQQVLQNLQAILTAAKLTKSQVVKTTIFLTDLSHFSAVNELYAEFFGDHRPARACVEVSALPKEALVEIECLASRGD